VTNETYQYCVNRAIMETFCGDLIGGGYRFSPRGAGKLVERIKELCAEAGICPKCGEKFEEGHNCMGDEENKDEDEKDGECVHPILERYEDPFGDYHYVCKKCGVCVYPHYYEKLYNQLRKEHDLMRETFVKELSSLLEKVKDEDEITR